MNGTRQVFRLASGRSTHALAASPGPARIIALGLFRVQSIRFKTKLKLGDADQVSYKQRPSAEIVESSRGRAFPARALDCQGIHSKNSDTTEAVFEIKVSRRSSILCCLVHHRRPAQHVSSARVTSVVIRAFSYEESSLMAFATH